MDNVWVHDLSPFLPYLRFSETIGIRYYSLAYIFGVVWGGWLIWRWSQRQRSPVHAAEVQDLMVSLALGMIFGGRLGYCLFYEPSLFLSWGDGFPWWGVLKLWNGGMASHGGAIGIAVACGWWAWQRRRSFPALADVVAVVIPIGVFLGRLANFINGELWGRPTDGSWGVIFPAAIREDLSLRYQQAQETLVGAEWQRFAQDYQEAWRRIPERHGDPAPWEAFLRAQGEWQAFLLEWGMPRHPSQLYAAVLEGLVVLALGLIVHKHHRRPGLSAGTVLAVYATVRIINECWRQWDQGLDPHFGFLTQGQALSIPFLVIGLGIIIWSWRRGPRPEAYLDQSPEAVD